MEIYTLVMPGTSHHQAHRAVNHLINTHNQIQLDILLRNKWAFHHKVIRMLRIWLHPGTNQHQVMANQQQTTVRLKMIVFKSKDLYIPDCFQYFNQFRIRTHCMHSNKLPRRVTNNKCTVHIIHTCNKTTNHGQSTRTERLPHQGLPNRICMVLRGQLPLQFKLCLKINRWAKLSNQLLKINKIWFRIIKIGR